MNAISKESAKDYQLMQWLAKHGLTQSKKLLGWRLASEQLGEIIGLPLSRGRLMATNGIDCLIETEIGTIYKGHVAFFIHDEVENEESTTTVKEPKTRAKKLMAEFCEA